MKSFIKISIISLIAVLLSGCMGGLYNRVNLDQSRNFTVGQELIDLKTAHTEGVITDIEYNKAKKTVLKSLNAYDKTKTKQKDSDKMIHVIASIGVKPGKREAFIKIFNANVPKVLAEDGCIEYIPAIDTESGIDAQWKDETVVTVIEKWATIEALHAHLAAPHMEQFKTDTANLVEDVSLTILEDA